MSSVDGVYKVLYKLGLTEDEAKKAFDTNTYLSKVLNTDVINVIRKFMKYGLTDKEIAEIAKQNPWMLTESFERMRYLEEYYKLVDITNYRELLIKQPIAMSINPKDLKDLIEKQKGERKSNDEIKEILLNNFTDYLSL